MDCSFQLRLVSRNPNRQSHRDLDRVCGIREIMSAKTNLLIDAILLLDLPRNAFCICGGAALEIRGLRANTHDIDLLVTDELYDHCRTEKRWVECLLSENAIPLAPAQMTSNEPLTTLVLEGSFPPIELLPLSHFVQTRSVSQKYIDEAEVIHGVRVITLAHLLEWKIAANRDKDRLDVKLITRYFDGLISETSR